MPERIAIYPGTFDPITNGHIDVIARATRMFDKVMVVIAVNRTKSVLFTESERLALARQALSDYQTVDVHSTSGLIVEFARQHNATAIIRGLRAISDFEYEMQMALMNRKLQEEINTIFMVPNERYTYLNSSIIRELNSYGADVSEFVPTCVAAALKKMQTKEQL